mmetsp:Transcript_36478/g.67158  ORF Transcript_36478/g.67158 Transcript_36478/m.67158 type:complete len:141 (-) Transcript_36478:112-534(-)
MGWVPDHIFYAQKGNKKGGSKGGKSWNKPSWGGGKGGGKKGGKGSFKGRNGYLWKAMAECKVWIGGLPDTGGKDNVMNKKLLEHMKHGGDCKFAEIKKGGTGGAVYKTPEDAQSAAMTLNGSVFQGHTLQVDTWEKMPKT